MRLSVTIPRPPSVNNLFANKKGGRFKTPHYKAWIQEAGIRLNQQTVDAPMISGPIKVLIILDKGRADLDNLCKPLLDLLVSHRLIHDDRNVNEIHMLHDAGHKGKCSVTVEAT
jgi:Holliday junction resolvase RusA-like endonuclease